MLTQTLLEGLDITALGAALPPLLIIGTRVSQAGACATAGSHSIALELALPTNHTGQSLRFGDVRIVGDGFAGGGRGVIVTVGAVRSFGASGAVIW